MSAVSGSEKAGSLQSGGRGPLPVPRRLLRLRSDTALAERFVAGDEAAFDVIYERHRPVVLAVCTGVLGAAHDAEDATQETFSALATELRSAIPAEPRAWLIRVARNASIDLTRRRRHRLLTFDGELPEVPAPPQVEAAELTTVISGIRELPENQRTALVMREMGGHSYNEIAETLETDEEAVRGLIARARHGLRGYREATELPCAVARLELDSEPDGRRYDRVVRRHLKVCKPCSRYRDDLRAGEHAVHAAVPAEAGTVIGGGAAGSGLSAGAFTAAKTGLAVSQIAATCAASVCAVGTVGGLVILHPGTHLFGLSGVRLSHADHHRATVGPAHPAATRPSSHGHVAHHLTMPMNMAPAALVTRHHHAAATVSRAAGSTTAGHRHVVVRHPRFFELGHRHGGTGTHRGWRRGNWSRDGWGAASHGRVSRAHWYGHSTGVGTVGHGYPSHPGAGGSRGTSPGGGAYGGGAYGGGPEGATGQGSSGWSGTGGSRGASASGGSATPGATGGSSASGGSATPGATGGSSVSGGSATPGATGGSSASPTSGSSSTVTPPFTAAPGPASNRVHPRRAGAISAGASATATSAAINSARR